MVKNLAADQITEYDPSIGNLSSQMRRLDFTQWSAALKHVLSILFYTCRKVQSIQELIIENIDQFIHLYNGDQTASHQSERYLLVHNFRKYFFGIKAEIWKKFQSNYFVPFEGIVRVEYRNCPLVFQMSRDLTAKQ